MVVIGDHWECESGFMKVLPLSEIGIWTWNIPFVKTEENSV